MTSKVPCPMCGGRQTMQHDSGPVECPACASRARNTIEDQIVTGLLGQQQAPAIASRYGSAKEAERLRRIHEPEELIGYVSEEGLRCLR